MKPKPYTRKAIQIQALLFTTPLSAEMIAFCGDHLGAVTTLEDGTVELEILTLEDGFDRRVKHIATAGDYIIKGVEGEFYACKPEIFNKTYQ